MQMSTRSVAVGKAHPSEILHYSTLSDLQLFPSQARPLVHSIACVQRFLSSQSNVQRPPHCSRPSPPHILSPSPCPRLHHHNSRLLNPLHPRRTRLCRASCRASPELLLPTPAYFHLLAATSAQSPFEIPSPTSNFGPQKPPKQRRKRPIERRLHHPQSTRN